MVLAIILGLGTVAAVLAVRKLTSGPAISSTDQTQATESFVPIDPNIKVTASLSTIKDNTVVITATGLGGKVASVAYELTYDSQGLIKGVNSGSKPIDVTGQNVFSREVYLGTCSRNVCKPDTGVAKVTVVLEFTNANGKKSQFSGDFDLATTGVSARSIVPSASLPPSD